MLKFKKTEVVLTDLDVTIKKHLAAMSDHAADSEEYGAMATHLKTLMEAKALEPKSDTVSPETWATLATNLAGILIITNYEHAHVITSKALSFVTKSKI